MNIKTINIGNTEKAIESLNEINDKNYGNIDIKIENLHLKELNKLLNNNVFKQNDAYVSAETLWQIMQPAGIKIVHNTHGLSPEIILQALKDASHPFCILKSYLNRYITISSFEINESRVLIIIEINASLRKNHEAKINKIVTIYPSDSINAYLRNKKILYLR